MGALSVWSLKPGICSGEGAGTGFTPPAVCAADCWVVCVAEAAEENADELTVVLFVAVLIALFAARLLAIPTRPPLKYSPMPPVLPVRVPPPPPAILPVAPVNALTPRVAMSASAMSEPPVCPTLRPMLCIKLSIFCETFKNATAHKNHTSTLPTTAPLPDASACASTSLSVMAKAGVTKNAPKRNATQRIPI